MARKTKNKRNRYQSRYQLGGLQGRQGLPQTGRLLRRLPEPSRLPKGLPKLPEERLQRFRKTCQRYY